MHKPCDDLRTSPENPELEHYKMLARVAEERAREIRRIAALERARLEERLLELEERLVEQESILGIRAEELGRIRSSIERLRTNSDRAREDSRGLKRELAVTKAQLKSLKRAHDRIASSRAHRLAEAYVRYATGRSLLIRAFQLLRRVGRGR